MNKSKTNSRKKYLKEAKKAFRKKHRTVTLSYPNAEAKVLMKEASCHNLKLHEFLKASISGYRNKIFIVPDNELVQKLTLKLSGIGNNVNQIARKCNQHDLSGIEAIKMARSEIGAIDQFITKTFREPWDVQEYLIKVQKDNPEKVQRILRSILFINSR